MIIANIIGGLGNQMFQFACGQALAAAAGQSVYYATDVFAQQSTHNGYELDKVFGLCAPLASAADIRKVLGPIRAQPTIRRILMKYQVPQVFLGKRFLIERGNVFDGSLVEKLSGGGYMHGYWQSERYFSLIADKIRSAFTFRNVEGVALPNRGHINVSMHVRRGDYLKAGSIHFSCNAEYYARALERFDFKANSTRVYVFSDDPAWAREALSDIHPNIYFVEGHIGADSYKDMYLISQCDHHIIANSSFSWWGAWLNPSPKKRVIAPKLWFSDPSLDDNDIVPQNWERL